MMRATVQYFICMVSLLLCLSAQGRLIDDLFSAEIEVSSQAASQRDEALRTAFEQVILKISGSEKTLEHRAIKNAKSQLDDYLLQYGYRRNGNTLYLTANFDGRKLSELFKVNQLPYWGSRRPELLMWVASSDERGKRHILAANDESIFIQQIRHLAKQRGLPLQFPLMDLTDATSVSISDIWGRFLTPIGDASQRYRADGYLVAKVAERGVTDDEPKAEGEAEKGRWRLDWVIRVGDIRKSGEVFANSRDFLAGPFMNQLHESLANEFALIASGESQLIQFPIRVEGLQGWQSILDIQRFIASVTSVQQVKLTDYSPTFSRFEVTLTDTPDHLLQAIELDGRLQQKRRDPFALREQSAEEETTYRWVATE
ncbi:MAG TPA: DUF2066 domain-containing protein [Idiomarina sp.]|nr:DUF2066 domain-containing protein [Idiomarina sp.]|tara:strand:- start:11561 stop:12673 length:1113 start_codon:yes stop_codon:yes gene_type:complete